MSENYLRFLRLVNILTVRNPDLKIKFKDESLLMKILSKILFFNPDFMTKYVTTIGSNIYFPNQQMLENIEHEGAIITLCHEYRHMIDQREMGSLKYTLMYLFPQILFPLFLILSICLSWCLLIPALISLMPLPAPGRKLIELNGYITNLVAFNCLLNEVNVNVEDKREFLKLAALDKAKNFTGFGYYLMWPFGVEKELNDAIELILLEQSEKIDVHLTEIETALFNSK